MNEAELVKKLETCVSYGEQEFNNLKNTLVQKFLKEYEGTINE